MSSKPRDRREYNRQWRERNKEWLKTYERKRPTKEQRKVEHRRWYLKHRDAILVKQREKYQANIEKHHAYERARSKERRSYRLAYFRKLKAEVITVYGGMCKCCGESTMEFLSIDHINGNGNKHRTEAKCGGGSSFYLWLKRYKFPTDNFQLLCFNCNFAKHRYGLCPHQKPLGGESA